MADAAWTLTGVGLLKSAASSEPEDRLCIPTTIDDGSAVSDRVACVSRGRRRRRKGGKVGLRVRFPGVCGKGVGGKKECRGLSAGQVPR